ncbi:hypothetical protein ACPXBC_31490, partial [Escherichia coli]|uniref:hypothetical protein n=1 Tax=Escherichia coli TaxID=562 RepID=UPI003CE57839
LDAGSELRLDANCALRPDEAPAFFAAVAPFAPAFVEEPYRGGFLNAPTIPPALPLAVDESLLPPEDRARLWPRLG